MTEKPQTAEGYPREQITIVRDTCLYIATKLGDLMDDLVVVGGLVPSLLIDQSELAGGVSPHAGTMDLDVGLSMALLDDGRYQEITSRLRSAGFSNDVNNDGNPARQRWKIGGAGKATVDFLIQPTVSNDTGGKLRNLETDFAAVISPGLHLAFQDRITVKLSGNTITGESATRDIWVCGPGAYVVLKALAFHSRGENKDAYDLFYVVRNFGSGVEDVAASLRPLLIDDFAIKAVDVLKSDFLDHDGIGPRRVAQFQMKGQRDDDIQADVVSFVRQLLERATDQPSGHRRRRLLESPGPECRQRRHRRMWGGVVRG